MVQTRPDVYHGVPFLLVLLPPERWIRHLPDPGHQSTDDGRATCSEAGRALKSRGAISGDNDGMGVGLHKLEGV